MSDSVVEYHIFWPRHAVPGSLAIVGTAPQVEKLLRLERAATRTLYSVRAVISDHIPLIGSLAELVSAPSRCPIHLNEHPLTIYLHHGGSSAVFFDLCADGGEALANVRVEVEADAPLSAFQAARTELNELLDTLMRRVWLPLVIARLELTDASGAPLAYQLLLPFPSCLRMGPLGGIHQYPALSELESLAREGICATSPYYRLLCAHRLYDGIGPLRRWLREASEKLGVELSLPKDLQVDHSLLEGLGFSSEARFGIRTVGDLHSKLTELRNQVAHFLVTKGEPQAPLHVSDGRTYLNFSIAGAALLHYGFLTLRELSTYFRQHIEPLLARGSILPLKERREHHRVIVLSASTGDAQPGAAGDAPQAARS